MRQEVGFVYLEFQNKVKRIPGTEARLRLQYAGRAGTVTTKVLDLFAPKGKTVEVILAW